MAKRKIIQFDPFAAENITPEIEKARENAKPRRRRYESEQQRRNATGSVTVAEYDWLQEWTAELDRDIDNVKVTNVVAALVRLAQQDEETRSKVAEMLFQEQVETVLEKLQRANPKITAQVVQNLAD